MHTLNLNILFSNGKMLPEKMLAKALPMLDAQIVDEIKAFLVKSMSPEGGFVNREGKPDLYYSLFGFFISRALGMRKEEDALRRFTEKTILTVTPPSPDFFSGTILYGALHKSNVASRALKSKLKQHLFTGKASTDYQIFMAMLALFYLKDYFSLIRLINRFRKPDSNSKEPPSTILAASLVMEKIRGRPTASLEKQLLTYYIKQGGFVALKNAPIPDLLSTAVSLYALRFCGSDLRLISPDCIGFVEHLYQDGGFCATGLDTETDVEYLFYGLLALGCLS